MGISKGLRQKVRDHVGIILVIFITDKKILAQLYTFVLNFPIYCLRYASDGIGSSPAAATKKRSPSITPLANVGYKIILC